MDEDTIQKKTINRSLKRHWVCIDCVCTDIRLGLMPLLVNKFLETRILFPLFVVLLTLNIYTIAK